MHIKIKFGYRWVLLPATRDNFELANALVGLPVYDGVYDADYRNETYYPTGERLANQFEVGKFTIDDSMTSIEAVEAIQKQRAALKQVEPALAEAAE